MRYYNIQIFDQSGKMFLEFQTKYGTGLNIELNAVINDLSQTGTATLKVFNLPLKYFLRQSDFRGKTILIKGGMSKGLPLANPAQQGILLFGEIQYCIGEREKGTNFLTFSIIYTAATPPKNGFILDWKKGTKLKDALKNTFQNAGVTANNFNINLDDNKWIAPQDVKAGYQSDKQFATYLDYITKGEVKMAVNAPAKTYLITDNSKTTPKPKVISIFDFIGQPTWTEGTGNDGKPTANVALPVVLRGDIYWWDEIEIQDPQVSKVGVSAAIGLPDNARVGFTGKVRVFQITHIANYSATGGENWQTLLTCQTLLS
jgi:hypothetical protein